MYAKLIFIKHTKGDEIFKEMGRQFVKSWAEFSIKIIKINLEVIGKEKIPETNCLFISNHQGYADIPILLSSVDKNLGFVAKKEMEKIPVLSTWMKLINCVFMDRSTPREGIKSINKAIDLLKSGNSLVIFPEGTRSKSDMVSEFKKGSMKLATKSGVAVVPVTIIDSYKAYEDGGFKKDKVNVKLIFNDPIYVDKLSKEEQANLSVITQNIISGTIIKEKNMLV
jgi:1-acyl-sn-glycerol-3-phosphate acyltransferase